MTLKTILNKLPYIRSLVNEVLIYKKGFPPGFFYSPIVDTEEIRKNSDRIFNSINLNGLILNTDKQFTLLSLLEKHYKELPFKENKSEGTFYYYENDTYSYSDAIFLYSVIRHFKPRNIIEIGSGFSSSVMYDTNKIFFNSSINIINIDPYPLHLKQAFGDRYKELNLIEKQIQDVPLTEFEKLSENDILFIDSTHVSKTGSDVNHIIFNILPTLKKGVLIHFHDIFFPFEYPKSWVLDTKFHNNGFGWNELYLLKSFLMYNDSFEIVLFNTMLESNYEKWFEEKMPLCLENKGGSIWLKKVK